MTAQIAITMSVHQGLMQDNIFATHTFLGGHIYTYKVCMYVHMCLMTRINYKQMCDTHFQCTTDNIYDLLRLSCSFIYHLSTTGVKWQVGGSLHNARVCSDTYHAPDM